MTKIHNGKQEGSLWPAVAHPQLNPPHTHVLALSLGTSCKNFGAKKFHRNDNL